MSQPSTLERFRPYSVPIALFTIVVVAVLLVPPAILGEATPRTYAITAAFLILAIGSAFPYALLVGVGTLPLLYAGIASYTAPRASADAHHPFSVTAALRHALAGVAYTLGAAAVGAIGMGAQLGGPDAVETVPAALQPVLLFLGGIVVGVAFVGLQLWRYETSLRDLDWRTSLGTVVLGGLLALAPAVAYWVFKVS